MGNGIAHVFAQHNYKVALIDVSTDILTKALSTIEKNLDRQLQKEKITQKIKDVTLANITTHTEIREGIKDADLVIEAAREMTMSLEGTAQ